MGRRRLSEHEDREIQAGQERPRNQALRNRLDELAYGLWDKETETRDGPGTYLRLFEVVENGAGLTLVGGSSNRGSIPDAVRLDVLDAIEEIALVVNEIERIQRRADGFMPAPRRRSQKTRDSWGLPPLDRTRGGLTPDERVLTSLIWLRQAVDSIEAGPGAWKPSEDEFAQRHWHGFEPDGWHAWVDSEINRIARGARGLCGAARAKVKGASCPYCQLDTIYLDPFDAEVAICVNAACTDEAGNQMVFRGWAAWAALDAAAAG